MDLEWRFFSEDHSETNAKGHRQAYLRTKAGNAKGAASKNFDDSKWRKLDLPHDFVVETDISEENDETLDYHKKGSAWYRKSFSLSDEFKNKQIAICLEGISLQADIFINGSLIHRSFSAYTEQFVDITDRVYVGGKPNTLAIHVNADPSLAECWSYEGGGIYRHVKLFAKDLSSHITHNGVFAFAELVDEKQKKWSLNVQIELENLSYQDSLCSLLVSVYDGSEIIKEQQTGPINVSKNSTGVFRTVSFDFENPKLWDVDSPFIYDVHVAVMRNDEIVDEEKVQTGFKYFRFDPNEGFFLNGRYLKLKGISCHQDHAGVGVAVPDSVQYKRIETLKNIGVNMYRSGHNNPAREVLEACDKLGILVIDENRHFEASKENLEHLAIITKRDRNHPSVFMYCLLNEEPLQNTQEGANIYRRMKEEVKKYDHTKLFTGAMHGNVSGAGREMDVCGINYGYGYLDNLHRDNPEICIFGSENNSQLATRGCYQTDRDGEHVIAGYDDECVPWGSTVKNNWAFARERKYLAGVTGWTGFDYHGETSMPWPTVVSEYGIIDMCGFYKDVAYFTKACYSDIPMIKLIPHWNFNVGDNVRVVAISNCEQTELIVNGISWGIFDSDCCKPNEWNVPFEEGYIEAKGYVNGQVVASDRRDTSKAPKSIDIETNGQTFNNSGNDTIIMNCSVRDENGVPCPLADNKLFFEIEGDATLLGVGNGDPNSHESEIKPERKLYYGLCQAIIRVNHNAQFVKIKVHGDELEEKVFVPVIENSKETNYIYSVVNNYITKLEATAPSEEWIDPLMKIDIDDMNTFLPLEIEDDCFQRDYRYGWKLYRIFLKLPQSGDNAVQRDYSLYFDDVKINKMFVYVDGKEIYKTNITHRYTEGVVNCEFRGTEGSTVELRALIHINIEGDSNGCGFRKSIRLI